jgi:hypothetical protein
MVDYDKFVSLMKPIIKWNTDCEKYEECLKTLTGSYPDEILGSSLHDSYCELVAELMGVDIEWLYWYIYEDRMGETGLCVAIGGVTKEIRNMEDLYWVLKETSSE